MRSLSGEDRGGKKVLSLGLRRGEVTVEVSKSEVLVYAEVRMRTE